MPCMAVMAGRPFNDVYQYWAGRLIEVDRCQQAGSRAARHTYKRQAGKKVHYCSSHHTVTQNIINSATSDVSDLHCMMQYCSPNDSSL